MSEPSILLRLFDVVGVLIALEFLVVWLWPRAAALLGRDALASLAAGAMLVVAIRVAIAGGEVHWVGLCLLGSFAAHLLDMNNRRRHTAQRMNG